MWTHESRVCWVSCMCWAGTSYQKNKSTTSVNTRVYSVLSVVCVELARLVRKTSPLPAWTHASRVRWVSCVLSWHVLSEEQVHYQCGHTSLERVECHVCWTGTSCQKNYQRGHTSLEWCVECRVCWAGTSCQKDGSCMSHRSATWYSWSYSRYDDSRGNCLQLCWSSWIQSCASRTNLQTFCYSITKS